MWCDASGSGSVVFALMWSLGQETRRHPVQTLTDRLWKRVV